MEENKDNLLEKETAEIKNLEIKTRNWFDRNYKLLMFIPIIIVIICLIYLASFYVAHNDIMYKDVSLSGGTTITLHGDMNFDEIESQLRTKYEDLSFRKLSDFRTGEIIAFIIESSSQPDELKKSIEEILGYELTSDNSSIEFTGPALSNNFYKQLIIALIVSFLLMSIVIFVLFRSFIPSMAVIFSAFSDIVMPLAIVDLFGLRISSAGIAAFLMLIGYSVDTDILLTTRALKTKGGTLNSRIHRAFKTGIFMTITAIIAVVPAFFIVTGLPDSFRQIFLILALGLFADILNTWLTNVGVIKWYCTRRKIE